jgi:hypothetical protein
MDHLTTSSRNLQLESELRKELLTGEHVLWKAMPDPARLRLIFAMWIFAIPWTLFSLVWTGIAIAAYLSTFAESATHLSGARWWGWIGPVWGLPFIAIGFWMLGKPLIVRADARYTLHALTNTRLITLTQRKTREVKTVSLTKLGPISIAEKSNGWGSISVETGSHVDSDGDRITERFQIDGVPDVARLHRLLLEAQQASVQ